MMTAKEIRSKYLNFFKAKGHSIIPSASLLPENDSSTLFISSGMQPLVPYLMGERHPEGKKLVNSQKSFRTEDIEEVGDNRHNTFFEMLGNWSLGDYFKKEQLTWYFEFLTEVLKIEPGRLYATVFRGHQELNIAKDEESVEIWKKLFKNKGIEAKDVDFAELHGLQDGRIFYYSEEKNWWSRSGVPANMPVGEIGGPDSEVFYDLGAELKKHENSSFRDFLCHVNCDCGRFVEIGNSVFMEFKKTENGFEKLKQQNVDFGGGLERTTMITQNKDNIFETDLFINIINRLELLANGKTYRDHTKPFEVIADHLKAASFILGDDKGVAPSNTDQGYIVRRLIRRALRYGQQLGIKEELWVKDIAKIIIHDYQEAYPELNRNADFIVNSLKEEENKFNHTLEKGLKQFDKLEREGKKEEKKITGQEAFDLYQTFGFPIEITSELAKERGLEIDTEGFKKELAKHQKLSRTASAGKFKGGLADAGEETKKLHTAAHLLLASLRKVLGAHVVQKGSNITAERLRFDFSHPEKLTDEQKQKVEELVNQAIKSKLPVRCDEMELSEAKNKGAVGVFESKYAQQVKVYRVGAEQDFFSKEICGGPHVDNIGELGKFKIVKEQSSSAGIRRIKAILE